MYFFCSVSLLTRWPQPCISAFIFSMSHIHTEKVCSISQLQPGSNVHISAECNVHRCTVWHSKHMQSCFSVLHYATQTALKIQEINEMCVCVRVCVCVCVCVCVLKHMRVRWLSWKQCNTRSLSFWPHLKTSHTNCFVNLLHVCKVHS